MQRVLKFRIVYQQEETGRMTERVIVLGEAIPTLGERWAIIGKNQFTGLLDKNGKEIYEGDILHVDWHDTRYPPHRIGPVSWSAEEAGFLLGEGGSPKHDADYFMEVIGNIYEHPELVMQ